MFSLALIILLSHEAKFFLASTPHLGGHSPGSPLTGMIIAADPLTKKYSKDVVVPRILKNPSVEHLRALRPHVKILWSGQSATFMRKNQILSGKPKTQTHTHTHKQAKWIQCSSKEKRMSIYNKYEKNRINIFKYATKSTLARQRGAFSMRTTERE